jgi:hypothetical protein
LYSKEKAMILQRDERLKPEIHHNGCYLMSILFMVNKYTNFSFSADLINHIYVKLLGRGWMENDCTILNPEAIFRYLELPVRYTDRHEPPTRICGPNEFEILLWSYPERGWLHFVAGNGCGITTYDPWGVSMTATRGHLESKRIFERLAA